MSRCILIDSLLKMATNSDEGCTDNHALQVDVVEKLGWVRPDGVGWCGVRGVVSRLVASRPVRCVVCCVVA